MKVAVIMRTYERPVLLARAIASVQQQSFRDWELVVVNNGGDPAVVDKVVDVARRTTSSGTITVLHLADRCGMEAAGIVTALGEGVTRYRIGDRIMGRAAGGFAEQTLLDEHDSIPVPDTVDWIDAGSIPIAYAVAYDMIVAHGRLKSGDTILITAVASGVGEIGRAHV